MNSPGQSQSSTVPAKQTSRILITGANGMIGHALRAAAVARQIETVPVQRPVRKDSMGSHQAPAAPGTILWMPEAAQPFADLELLEGFDAVVHLAGANISSHRWTSAYKKTIIDSRTLTTGALALALARLRNPPKVLVSASATGFYGSRGDEVMTEASAAGKGFLSEVCQVWENATAPAEAAGIRVAHLRSGVVLTPFGGALKQMLPLFRMGAGGRLGNGAQWMSWITLDDLLGAIFHIVDDRSLHGPVNLVAPGPVRNAEFTKALGAALGRPAILPAPAFALRAAFGQMADDAMLASCRAEPAKLQGSGFHFSHPSIQDALQSMLKQPRRAD